MESIIRIVLLVLGCFVILWILINGLKRNRQKGEKKVQTLGELPVQATSSATDNISQNFPAVSSVEFKEPLKEEILSLRIMAPKNRKFGGYALLQTLSANDFHYGDMQIFHRYADEQKKEPLFSLVSIEEPGDFNLTEIGKFSSRGLVLFMDASAHDNPLLVFDDMMNIACLLAEDLQAELEFDSQTPLTVENVEIVRRRLGAK